MKDNETPEDPPLTVVVDRVIIVEERAVAGAPPAEGGNPPVGHALPTAEPTRP